MATDGETTPPADVLAEITAVAARAKAGDPAAVPRLRELMDAHPALWRHYGDLAAQAGAAWVSLAAGPDLHLREALLRVAAEQRAALTRPAAPPVELLLVDRAVACWVQVAYFAAMEAKAVEAQSPPGVLRYWAGRHALAQRMHQSALAALLAVQRRLPAGDRPTRTTTRSQPRPAAAPTGPRVRAGSNPRPRPARDGRAHAGAGR